MPPGVLARVYVTPKRGILDPQGKAVQHSLHALGFAEVNDVKVEVVARNIVAGSLAKRLGKPEGELLPEPILEHFYKDDALDDPMINDWHIRYLKLATAQELSYINETALRVNALLREFLDQRNIVLVDMKLEFGRHHGKILLADEICPDTCRFWDKQSGEKLDKDRFRRDMGGVEDAYQEATRRICSAAA